MDFDLGRILYDGDNWKILKILTPSLPPILSFVLIIPRLFFKDRFFDRSLFFYEIYQIDIYLELVHSYGLIQDICLYICLYICLFGKFHK